MTAVVITLMFPCMKAWLFYSALFGVVISAAAKPDAEQSAKLPPPVAREVDFIRDIQPILEKKCVQCHGRGHDKGGFRLDTKELLLGESDNGHSVILGKSGDSPFIHLVAGLDPDNLMPKKGSKLTMEQVGLLRAWIDQGAPWPSGINFAKQPPLNLLPVFVALPLTKKNLHPIDALLAPYFQTNGVQTTAIVDDQMFARRVYLDLVGLLPDSSEVNAFLKDKKADKRERLVTKLLNDNTRYAEHWLTFWNDLLRNDYRGTGYIDGGRKQITAWLYSSLLTNKPYDQFVAELVHPTQETEGFAKGIVWRGAVNASQLPPLQAAQNISQVFMGVNLKCASCHDSFIDDWKLSDAYNLAGVYADGPLELVECDKPLGKMAKVSFIYPELGSLPTSTNKAERTARLAEILTGRENGRLPRTIINRLWQRFLGRGLVEPVDIMEQPAWHPELMNWLAEDLVANGYDLRKTMFLILTSRTYQLPADLKFQEADKNYVFRGPLVRRMSAEQFVDSVSQITGIWQNKPADSFGFSSNQVKSMTGGTRAALVAANPLMTALDRPNREQLVTVRQSTPTTLQALELTNGRTLSLMLRLGSAQLAMDAESLGSQMLASRLYRQAFTRDPGQTERELAGTLLGRNPTPEAIEDYLWSIVMQPEFQLIY
jgi:hypothetical protein